MTLNSPNLTGPLNDAFRIQNSAFDVHERLNRWSECNEGKKKADLRGSGNVFMEIICIVQIKDNQICTFYCLVYPPTPNRKKIKNFPLINLMTVVYKYCGIWLRKERE